MHVGVRTVHCPCNYQAIASKHTRPTPPFIERTCSTTCRGVFSWKTRESSSDYETSSNPRMKVRMIALLCKIPLNVSDTGHCKPLAHERAGTGISPKTLAYTDRKDLEVVPEVCLYKSGMDRSRLEGAPAATSVVKRGRSTCNSYHLNSSKNTRSHCKEVSYSPSSHACSHKGDENIVANGTMTVHVTPTHASKRSRLPGYLCRNSRLMPCLKTMTAPTFSSYLSTLVLGLAILLHLLPWTSAVVYRRAMSTRVIPTRYGNVRGLLTEFPNRELKPVEAYFGLRYADLEKGSMRFMPPKNPKEQWNGVRAAVPEKQPACPQLLQHQKEYEELMPDDRAAHLRNITPFLDMQTEDCLTLNLYVPIPGWNESAMPVMVFIHGESYESGTGNAYDGSVLASFGGVIVVTLNYRLGVLGFMTTLDHFALGNLGLLDITQALLWLQENIALFNGDPKRITLFGHGHGAAMVNLLLVSPFLTEKGPHFHQAIIQSGSGLSTWAVSYDPLWCTQKLALNVNCSSYLGNSNKLVYCLRQKSVTELLNAVPKAPKYYSCFSPAVDGWTILPHPVEQLIKEKKSRFAQVPVMFGITKNEAYSYLKPQEVHKGISDFRKIQVIRTYVQNVFRYHRQTIFEILDHQYSDWTQPPDPISNRNHILELLSDGQYVAPLMKTANYHAETANTYMYAFSYSTQSESPSSAQDKEDTSEKGFSSLQGIHGDELPYVFGSPLVDGISPFPSTYNSFEKMMSEAVMTYWTNFAKTGNPNEPRNQTSVHGGKILNRFMNMTWPVYEKDTQQYMLISHRPAIRHHYRGQKLAMWLDLIPKVNKQDGSDPSTHLLDHSNNQTTFDDYLRLIPPPINVFPIPPPMPPIAPTVSTYNPSTASSFPSTSTFQDDTTCDDVASEIEIDTTAPVPVPHITEEHFTSSVPLSVTVSVGCFLIFLNLLILAAVYYQRERIRKLRQQPDPDDMDDVKLNRKLERDATRNSSVRMETDSLASAGAGGVGDFLEGTKGGHEDSPGRGFITAGGEGGSNSGTLGRRSPPQNGKKASSGALSRNSMDASLGYNYTAVPTQSTSPVHRTHVHTQGPARALPPSVAVKPSAATVNVNPFHHPHTTTPPSLPMNTFGNNVNPLNMKGTRIGSGVGGIGTPRGGGSEAADTGLYKVINKSAPPPQNRDSLGNANSGGVTSAPSANNAITIV